MLLGRGGLSLIPSLWEGLSLSQGPFSEPRNRPEQVDSVSQAPELDWGSWGTAKPRFGSQRDLPMGQQSATPLKTLGSGGQEQGH